MRRALLIGLATLVAACGGGTDDPQPRQPRAATEPRPEQPERPVPGRAWPESISSDYAMFSRAGNRAARRVIVRAAERIKAGATREELLAAVTRDFERLVRRYPEADDTMSIELFANELDRWLLAAGLDPIDAYDEIRPL